MQRTLVTYASRAGATAEIAHVIAAQLRAAGLDVTCCEIREAHGVDRYEAFVIGSAVYAGHWMRPARAFLRRNRELLESRPLWAFSSGPVGAPRAGQTGHAGSTEPKRVSSELRRLGARDTIAFGGRVADDPRGFTARAVARNTPEEYRDRRDWCEIRAWADTIAAVLAPVTEIDSSTTAAARAGEPARRRAPEPVGV